MIKRIIFFVETRFNLRDYQRFGIELLQQNGFDIEVWDLSFIVHPETFKEYVPQDVFSFNVLTTFMNNREFHSRFRTLSRSDFVVNVLGYTFSNLAVYKALSRSRADYAIFYANLPEPVVERQW